MLPHNNSKKEEKEEKDDDFEIEVDENFLDNLVEEPQTEKSNSNPNTADPFSVDPNTAEKYELDYDEEHKEIFTPEQEEQEEDVVNTEEEVVVNTAIEDTKPNVSTDNNAPLKTENDKIEEAIKKLLGKQVSKDVKITFHSTNENVFFIHFPLDTTISITLRSSAIEILKDFIYKDDTINANDSLVKDSNVIPLSKQNFKNIDQQKFEQLTEKFKALHERLNQSPFKSQLKKGKKASKKAKKKTSGEVKPAMQKKLTAEEKSEQKKVLRAQQTIHKTPPSTTIPPVETRPVPPPQVSEVNRPSENSQVEVEAPLQVRLGIKKAQLEVLKNKLIDRRTKNTQSFLGLKNKAERGGELTENEKKAMEIIGAANSKINQFLAYFKEAEQSISDALRTKEKLVPQHFNTYFTRLEKLIENTKVFLNSFDKGKNTNNNETPTPSSNPLPESLEDLKKVPKNVTFDNEEPLPEETPKKVEEEKAKKTLKETLEPTSKSSGVNLQVPVNNVSSNPEDSSSSQSDSSSSPTDATLMQEDFQVVENFKKILKLLTNKKSDPTSTLDLKTIESQLATFIKNKNHMHSLAKLPGKLPVRIAKVKSILEDPSFKEFDSTAYNEIEQIIKKVESLTNTNVINNISDHKIQTISIFSEPPTILSRAKMYSEMAMKKTGTRGTTQKEIEEFKEKVLETKFLIEHTLNHLNKNPSENSETIRANLTQAADYISSALKTLTANTSLSKFNSFSDRSNPIKASELAAFIQNLGGTTTSNLGFSNSKETNSVKQHQFLQEEQVLANVDKFKLKNEESEKDFASSQHANGDTQLHYTNEDFLKLSLPNRVELAFRQVENFFALNGPDAVLTPFPGVGADMAITLEIICKKLNFAFDSSELSPKTIKQIKEFSHKEIPSGSKHSKYAKDLPENSSRMDYLYETISGIMDENKEKFTRGNASLVLNQSELDQFENMGLPQSTEKTSPPNKNEDSTIKIEVNNKPSQPSR